MMLPAARLPATRMVRAPLAWVVLSVAAMMVVAVGVRGGRGGSLAVDHVVALLGTAVVPIVSFGFVSAALGGRSIAVAAAPLFAFGATKRVGAVAHVAVAAVCAVAITMLLAIAVVLLSSGGTAPGVFGDALVTAFVTALGASAYVALFAFGSSFGSRGAGRGVLFVADWALGDAGPIAWIFPRIHLKNLLGMAVSPAIPPRASSVVLLVLVLALGGLALRRSTR